MDIFLIFIAAFLFGINLLITMIAIIEIGGTCIPNFVKSDAYLGVALLIWGVMTLVNSILTATLAVFNHASLALLIQVGILVICVLLIMIFGKIDYERNMKAYLQIKI